ncbi:MAG: nicotinate-nicotinamide nucleotide adenylyltransferase [Deltaproteobacteria bacterium]
MSIKPDPLPQQIEKLRRLKESSILLVRKAPQGISQKRGRLGIFPASFNPPTRAHLALIRKARRGGHLDEVLVLLDAQAMDKKIIGADLEDRVIMLKILFQKDPKVSIGISSRGLFVEKMLPLKRMYPFSVSFIFIVGFDTILRVMDKRYYSNRDETLDRLFGLCEFLVANRDGKEENSFEEFFGRDENQRYRDKVSFVTLPSRFSFLSSSLIRENLREGKPVQDWVPVPVLRFIQKKGLYNP